MKKKLYAAALAFALVISGCGDGGSGNSADKATAVEMRLQRLVGTVTLTNDKGENQSLIEKMRLASGNALATDIESLVMVSLDETKLVTMEEKSKASITAKDKALQLNLEEGNLFFNVKEKIPEGSSFEIHNGNMVCGIRGTSGYEGKDAAGNPVVMATDGKIDITAEDPISHKKVQTTAEAGDMVVVYLDDESEGERQVSFEKKKYKEEDLPAVALDSIKKDDELQTRIAEETGFSVEKIKALAEASSVEGSSMYGQAADEFKSKGQEDAVPLMGKSSQIMTKTALKASDTAGTNLNLEIAIIKGLRTTLDTGVKARYNDNALEKLVETASDQVNKGVDQAVKAGLKDKDIITAAETMTKAINVSAGKMMDKGLSSEEVTQVVDTIGKVYEQAISTGSLAGGAAEVLKSVETAAARVDQTVETQMQQNSNGEKTATALIGNNTSGQNPGNTQPAGQTAAPAATPAAAAPAVEATPAQNTTENISASNDDDDDDDYSYSSSLSSSGTSSTTSPTSDNKNNTSGGTGGNTSGGSSGGSATYATASIDRDEWDRTVKTLYSSAQTFSKAGSAPDASIQVETNNIADSTGGHVWVWENASNVYWWSDAATVYMPSNCSFLFGIDSNNSSGNTPHTSINLSGLDFSNATNMKGMFRSCKNLTSLNLGGMNTSNVTDMSYMFQYCVKLPSLNVSSFNTSSVTTMDHMFADCQSVEGTLDVSNFNTSLVKTFKYMFYDCYEVVAINTGGFDTSSVTSAGDYEGTFNTCSNLVTIYSSTNWKIDGLAGDITYSRTFLGSPNIKGGNNTPYNNSDDDRGRGNHLIIGNGSNGGYFTAP